MTGSLRGPGRLLALAALGALSLSCGGGLAPPVAPGPPAATGAAGLPEGAVGQQSLFRATYEGPEGRGALRLTLRLAAPDHYRLSASDGFGRAIWSLEREAARVVLVDHRRSSWCSLGDSLGMPELSLSEIPLSAIPAVLLGAFPVAGVAGPEADVVDAFGRRWTGRWRDGRLTSWTLWRDGEPMVWWQGAGAEGTLSHRQGMQLRWRRTVVEELDPGLEVLEIPADYREGLCDVARLP